MAGAQTRPHPHPPTEHTAGSAVCLAVQPWLIARGGLVWCGVARPGLIVGEWKIVTGWQPIGPFGSGGSPRCDNRTAMQNDGIGWGKEGAASDPEKSPKGWGRYGVNCDCGGPSGPKLR